MRKNQLLYQRHRIGYFDGMKGPVSICWKQFGGRPCISGSQTRVNDMRDLRVVEVRHAEIPENYRYPEFAAAEADHSPHAVR